MTTTKGRQPYDPADLTRSLLDTVDALDQLQDTVIARRRALEAAGFSPTVAEHMAAAVWCGAVNPGGTA